MNYIRIILAAITLFTLTGCASMTYIQAPDGTVTVTYYRMMTGSDTIKAKVGDAGIEAQGQKTIDPATIQAIFDILGKVK